MDSDGLCGCKCMLDADNYEDKSKLRLWALDEKIWNITYPAPDSFPEWTIINNAEQW